MQSKMDAENELDRFKREIDLRVFAEARFGYVADSRASGPHSALLKREDGDKVVVRLNAHDGHWEYFSVRDDRDHGTVIDFALRRLPGSTLGTVRMELRKFVGWTRDHPESRRPALRPATTDLAAVELAYAKFEVIGPGSYLAVNRGIPEDVLESARFAGRIREDQYGNAIFPHFGKGGALTGFEIRGPGRKGFALGGLKGLWTSNVRSEDCDIVFCESAIDCLSHATLFPAVYRRYAAIGGRTSELQRELIVEAIQAMPPASAQPCAYVISAMDADKAGAELRDIIKTAWENSGRSDLRFFDPLPRGAKDWNELLMKEKEHL